MVNTPKKLNKDLLFLELLLIGIALVLTFLVYHINGAKMVILNLFYLPVVLSGFFLGRYRAGILSLFCVIAASVVTMLQLRSFAVVDSPLTVGLAVTVWGAALCLTALLIGTLSDEKNNKVHELHEAYVGVVEVLSKYLQSANPRLKARSTRVAELSQAVASEMRLPPHQADDIRVAALMQDLGKIEVTTRLVSKAVDTLESQPGLLVQNSFQGGDLVQSLGEVLKGAIPLLVSQDDTMQAWLQMHEPLAAVEIPIGAKIIRVVRAYDQLTEAGMSGHWSTPGAALAELRRDRSLPQDEAVLAALERAVLGHARKAAKPALT